MCYVLNALSGVCTLSDGDMYSIFIENEKEVLVDSEGYIHIFLDSYENELSVCKALKIIKENETEEIFSLSSIRTPVYPY